MSNGSFLLKIGRELKQSNRLVRENSRFSFSSFELSIANILQNFCTKFRDCDMTYSAILCRKYQFSIHQLKNCISNFFAGGAAEKAGLRFGDKIIRVSITWLLDFKSNCSCRSVVLPRRHCVVP